jgi:hypothetical protein
MSALLILLSIILEGIEDALRDLGKKSIAKIIREFKRVSECSAFAVYFFFVEVNFFHGLIGLILFLWILRFAVFDWPYNLVSRLPINFIGNTSFLYDNLMQRIKTWQYWVFKLTALALAIFIYIKL